MNNEEKNVDFDIFCYFCVIIIYLEGNGTIFELYRAVASYKNVKINPISSSRRDGGANVYDRNGKDNQQTIKEKGTSGSDT